MVEQAMQALCNIVVGGFGLVILCLGVWAVCAAIRSL